MNAIHSSTLKILVVLSLALILCSCGGPAPPKPGTPAFQWNSAVAAYKTGDFLKACDLLTELSKGKSEFAPKAQPSAILLTYASAKSYMELAEQYEEGGKKSRTQGAAFRGRVNEYRAKTNTAAMQLLEASRAFTDANKDGAVKDKEVILLFAPSQAVLEDPPQYQKFSTGIMVPEAEVIEAERHVLRHQYLLTTAGALDMAKEPRKAETAFQNGEAKAPGAAFLLNLGKGLSEIADMFGPKKLNQPHRILAVVYDEELEALNPVKDNKDAKDLIKKATEARKKLNP